MTTGYLRRACATLALLAAVLVAAPAAAFDTSAKEAILIDMTTDQPLYEKDADAPMPPSSMAKMMTIYILFEELEAGRVKLNDRMPVSKKAWRMGGSKMFVEVGDSVSVEDLIRGIIVDSGNDAAIVVAEGLAGSEAAFAERMNKTAKQLGLTHSHFTNATGWPDPDLFVTARDLSTLAIHLIRDFPQYYHYFAETDFKYGNMAPQGNRNPLLYRPGTGADGLKTGHTEAGGYGLTASAERAGRRLVLVLNGLKSVRARAEESQRMLNWGFRNFGNVHLFKAGDKVAKADVWLGTKDEVSLVAPKPVVATLPRGSRDGMTVKAVFNEPVPAPIRKGDRIAKLVVDAKGVPPREFPLVAGANVGKAGFFGRLRTALGQVLAGALN